MKYDFSRCNNLQFKVKDREGKEREGYLKISSRGRVYVYYSDENEIFNPFLQIEFNSHYEIFTETTNFREWAENHGLEIIPRDPETYSDWKVGDRVRCMSGAEVVYDIAAKLGEVVFLSKNHSQVLTLPINILVRDFKLILTDYEKELIHAQELEEKKKKCPFKEGDKVLVRDSDTSWKFDIFQNYEENACYSYECLGSEYEQCIPLNEHTWKLLGTTDEYKEEE